MAAASKGDIIEVTTYGIARKPGDVISVTRGNSGGICNVGKVLRVTTGTPTVLIVKVTA